MRTQDSRPSILQAGFSRVGCMDQLAAESSARSVPAQVSEAHPDRLEQNPRGEGTEICSDAPLLGGATEAPAASVMKGAVNKWLLITMKASGLGNDVLFAQNGHDDRLSHACIKISFLDRRGAYGGLANPQGGHTRPRDRPSIRVGVPPQWVSGRRDLRAWLWGQAELYPLL